MSKTKNYLVPIINTFSKKFIEKISLVDKVSWKIGHKKYNELFPKEYNLFLLARPTEELDLFLDFFRSYRYYTADYIHNNYHMVVIKLPKKFHNSVDKFKESKYSEMYNKKDIKSLFEQFTNGDINPIYYILSRDKRYKTRFKDKLTEKYNLDIDIDIEDREWDFPIVIKKEIWQE